MAINSEIQSNQNCDELKAAFLDDQPERSRMDEQQEDEAVRAMRHTFSSLPKPQESPNEDSAKHLQLKEEIQHGRDNSRMTYNSSLRMKINRSQPRSDSNQMTNLNRNIASNMATNSKLEPGHVRKSSHVVKDYHDSKLSQGSLKASNDSRVFERNSQTKRGSKSPPIYNSIDNRGLKTSDNSKFLDKILHQYENDQSPVYFVRSSDKEMIRSGLRSKSLKQRAARKKKKLVAKSKSNERECTFVNDPTLDTLEVQKIDEAIANVTPPEELQTSESKKEQFAKATIRMKKHPTSYIIVRGKKYRVVKDNYLVQHDQFIPKKNQNVFMGSGYGISALKNVENRTRIVLRNPTITQKSPATSHGSNSRYLTPKDEKPARAVKRSNTNIENDDRSVNFYTEQINDIVN